MAERALRDVQNIRCIRYAPTFMNGFDRAQMAKFDMHFHMKLITFFNFMNLIQNHISGTKWQDNLWI